MQLLFKQRLFSWFDSYDIYDESGNTVYTVKGKLSWGHLLKSMTVSITISEPYRRECSPFCLNFLCT